eukprot:gene18830-20726_t
MLQRRTRQTAIWLVFCLIIVTVVLQFYFIQSGEKQLTIDERRNEEHENEAERIDRIIRTVDEDRIRLEKKWRNRIKSMHNIIQPVTVSEILTTANSNEEKLQKTTAESLHVGIPSSKSESFEKDKNIPRTMPQTSKAELKTNAPTNTKSRHPETSEDLNKNVQSAKLESSDEKASSNVPKTEQVKPAKLQRKLIAPKVACEIPRLDPFDKSAMSQMKDVRPLKCAREYFSTLKNGYLSLKIKGIYDAYMQYIQRPFQDDFEVQYSKKMNLSRSYKKSKLKKDKVGCIMNNNNEVLAFREAVKGQENRLLYLSSEIKCSHEHFWSLLSNGRIEHYLQDICISLNRSSKAEEMQYIATKCNEETDVFEFQRDGTTIHDKSQNLYLLSANSMIVAAANASQKSNWYLLESFLQDIDTKFQVTEEFVKLTFVKGKKVHEEYHAEVVEKGDLINKAKRVSKKASLPYNVAFFLVDSQSNSNVQRRMPKTYEALKNDNNTVIFKGHTIVGDGTTPQLCAIFAGELEENLPEGRRGFKGAQPVDRWPFLFKTFHKHGYLTLFSEEEPLYGSFNYRLHGFKDQPTDHYARPFWMATHIDYFREGECVGDTPVFQKNIDYTLSFLDRYRGVPKMSLAVISTICHNDVNRVQNADEGVANILNRMKNSGILDDTIVVIFGDHGARLSGFRETMVGKLEERLPFLSITLPSRLISSHPNIYQAMKHNSEILTSHFDIHATLKHMLIYPTVPEVNKGQSLLTYINKTRRDCKSAGIKEHWCPCLQFQALNSSNEMAIKSAKAIVDYINTNITFAIPGGRLHCAELQLDSIKRAGRRVPNKVVQTFIETSSNDKCVECGLVLKDDKSDNKDTIVLEVVFSVKPSGGIFEASVTIDKNDLIIVNPNISRINKYGSQPKCVQDKYPFLRKYCYCK